MRKSIFIMDSAHTWALLLAITVPFVTLERLSPVGVTWWGLVSGGILAVVAALRPREVRDSSLTSLASFALGAAALFFLVRGALAASPAVSLFGIIGQHNGAALWALGLCWFVIGKRFTTRTSFRRSVAIVSLGGVAYGIATIIEALSSGLERDWGAVAGVFENSSSLGQFMALAVGTSLAWALLARTKGTRWAAYGSAAFAVAVIVLAQSRAGFLGILIGAGIALAMHLWRPGDKAALGFGAAATADGLLISGLFVAASLGVLGKNALLLAERLGNSRDMIWRSGYEAFRQSPIAGRGLEQFSACVEWTFREGQLNFYGTSDPHNAGMAILIGGGVLGSGLSVVSAAAGLGALVSAFMRSRRSRVFAAVIGGVVAVPATALVTWFAPVAVVAAAYLAGSVVSLADAASGDIHEVATLEITAQAARWLPAAAGGLALLLALYSFPGLTSEVSLEMMRRKNSSTADSLLELTSWPDPSFASLAVNGYLAELQAAQDAGARDLAVVDGRNAIRRWGSHATWHFDLAVSSVIFEQAVAISGGGDWDLYESALTSGKRADPATGLWDFLGAVAADFLERPEEADSYATEALKYPLGTEEEALARTILTK